MKSSMALPSRRNSGLEATAKRSVERCSPMMAVSLRLVPTGTVDLVTMTVKWFGRGALAA